ncbi:uncharacterized protein LOC129802328 isoform X2 [Phlebotomus papatasi]|nr:uncharacterized protein LOC129802328 isoform X2 [Phlebotomus papatasi]
MPDSCCVEYCRKKRGKNADVILFRFPNDEDVRKKWVKAIQKIYPNWAPSKCPKICIDHFKENDLAGTGGKNSSKKCYLKKNVVPSQFKRKVDNSCITTIENYLKTRAACIVHDCDSHLSGEPVTHLGLPSTPELRQTWIKAIPRRQGMFFNDKTLICINHFKTTDIMRRSRTNGIRSLRPNTVPSIFPPSAVLLKEKELNAIRLEQERMEKSKQYFNDLTSNFEKLKQTYLERIKKTILGKFRARITDTYITFFRIDFSANGVPTIKSTLTVSDSMEITITINNQLVHHKYFEQYMTHGTKLITFSQLENLLNAISVDFDQCPRPQLPYKDSLKSLKKTITDMVEDSDDYDDCDSNELQMLLINLRDIIYAQGNTPRYPVEMIVQGAKLLNMAGTSYNMIRRLILYPGEKNILNYISPDMNQLPWNSNERKILQRTDEEMNT